MDQPRINIDITGMVINKQINTIETNRVPAQYIDLLTYYSYTLYIAVHYL